MKELDPSFVGVVYPSPIKYSKISKESFDVYFPGSFFSLYLTFVWFLTGCSTHDNQTMISVISEYF